jgi:hypothetical protein
MSKEAMKLALEALKEAQTNYDGQEYWDRNKNAIKALTEALAKQEQPYAFEAAMYSNDRMTVDPQTGNVSIGKQEQGEPVAWEQFHGHMAGPFYQAPQQRTWVGLTDEERKDLCRSWSSPMDAIYATEAKLKEKNT